MWTCQCGTNHHNAVSRCPTCQSWSPEILAQARTPQPLAQTTQPKPKEKEWESFKKFAIPIGVVLLLLLLFTRTPSTGSGDYYVLVDPADDDACWVVVIMHGNETILDGEDYRDCGKQRIYFDQCNTTVDVFFSPKHIPETGEDYLGDTEFRVYSKETGTGWGKIVQNGQPYSVEVDCATWVAID